jgi:hypothetical protein
MSRGLSGPTVRLATPTYRGLREWRGSNLYPDVLCRLPRCPTLGGRLAGHTREYDRAPAPQGGLVIRPSSMLRGHPVDGRAHPARLERNALILVFAHANSPRHLLAIGARAPLIIASVTLAPCSQRDRDTRSTKLERRIVTKRGYRACASNVIGWARRSHPMCGRTASSSSEQG